MSAVSGCLVYGHSVYLEWGEGGGGNLITSTDDLPPTQKLKVQSDLPLYPLQSHLCLSVKNQGGNCCPGSEFQDQYFLEKLL